MRSLFEQMMVSAHKPPVVSADCRQVTMLNKTRIIGYIPIERQKVVETRISKLLGKAT